MSKFYFSSISVTLAMVIISGCSSDEPSADTQRQFSYTEAATLSGYSDTAATFAIYPAGSSTPIEISRDVSIPSSMAKKSNRFMLTYTSPHVATPLDFPEDITLRTIAPMTVLPLSEESAEADSQPLELISAWLTGPWLNLNVSAPASMDLSSLHIAPDATDMADVANVANVADEAFNEEKISALQLWRSGGAASAPIYSRNFYLSIDLNEWLATLPVGTDAITLHTPESTNPNTRNVKLALPVAGR